METLIRLWKQSLFLWPSVLFFTFFLSILFFHSNKRYSNIPLSIKIYVLSFCICIIILDATVLITNRFNGSVKNIYSFVDFFLSILEFVLLAYYFYNLNKNIRQKKALIYLTVVFLLAAISLSFQLPSQHAVVRLYTIQGILLLLPTFFYFRTLFKTKSVINISNEPTFWISTGIAFFLLCTIILSIIETFILNHRPDILVKVYPTYYVFYIIMFCMFLKGYLCKTVISR